MNNLNVGMESVLDTLKTSDKESYALVNREWELPSVYQGSGPIRLIVLGQDPTINDETRVGETTMVLRLDSGGPLRNYIKGLCNLLGLEFSLNLYGTNLYKNFFIEPPVQLAKQKAPWVFERFRDIWLPFLKRELEEFDNVPVITLGEPILRVLANDGGRKSVKDYWGYTSNWKEGMTGDFTHLPATENLLERTIFPFPHATSARSKKFYSGRLKPYIEYMKQYIRRN